MDKPTNGTNSGVTFTATATSALSVSSDGKITVKAGTTAGKYQIAVTATDNESRSTITKTMTVYIKPTIVNNSIEMSYGEKIFIIEMKGLSSSIASATSSSGTFTPIDGGYRVTLNNAFADTKTFVYKLRVNDKDFEYSVNLKKTSKILKINNAFTIFNNGYQTPDFYDENEACETVTSSSVSDCIDYYKNQNDLFT